jgi:hypothetical protein
MVLLTKFHPGIRRIAVWAKVSVGRANSALATLPMYPPIHTGCHAPVGPGPILQAHQIASSNEFDIIWNFRIGK